MAASKIDNTEELTKCPICFEVFINPKYLPCLHTFCETCIDKYIITSALELKQGFPSTFSCPLCRSEVPAVGSKDSALGSSTTPDQWAKSLPTNHLFVSLMDQLQINKSQKKCESCSRNVKENMANVWCTDCGEAICQQCSDGHKYVKVTTTHTFIPLEEFQKDPSKYATYAEYCPKHKTKVLEIYCFDHDEACCSTCIVHHRKCDHVTTLEEAARDIRNKPEVDNLLSEMEDNLSKLTFLSKTIDSNISDLVKEKSTVRENIGSIKREIVRYLEDLETEMLKEVDEKYTQQDCNLNTRLAKVNNLQKTLMSNKLYLDTSRRCACDVQLFLDCRRLSKQSNRHKEFLVELQTNFRLVDNKFRSYRSMDAIKTFLACLGQLSTYQSEFVFPGRDLLSQNWRQNDYSQYAIADTKPATVFRALSSAVLKANVKQDLSRKGTKDKRRF